MKIWGSPMKIWGLQWKYGVSNENMGVSNEKMGSPMKIWGLQQEYVGFQRDVHEGLQWKRVSNSTPMMMTSYQIQKIVFFISNFSISIL